MHRKRSFSAVLGVACLAVMAVVFTVVGPAAAKVNTHQAAKVTVVTVTAGKPSELAFKLSKFSALPAGPITFKVTNMGLGCHNFKICTTPVTSVAKNACVGKVTKLLHHGDTATLTVTLTKNGKYEYLCAVPGHAAAGMKGLLGVGVKVAAPTRTSRPPTSTNTPRGTTTTTRPAAVAAAAAAAASVASECPPGQTIAANGTGDQDDDDMPVAPTGDGCI